VCQRYVTGTEAGYCPGCGFVPPVALDLAEVVPDVGVRASRSWISPLRLLAVMALGLAIVELVRTISP
jgi:hypothetical protein